MIDTKMHTLAIIPARSGSKGIINKNLQTIDNKSLLQISVEVALQVNEIDKLVVSTDSPLYAELGKKFGAEVPFLRPEDISGPEATATMVIRHALEHYRKSGENFDQVIYLQPTSPFRNEDDIKACIKLLKKYQEVVTVVDIPHNFRPESLFVKDEDDSVSHYQQNISKVYIRQKKSDKFLARNGPAVYAAKTSFILSQEIYTGQIGCVEMPRERSFDIDDTFDLTIARAMKNELK